MITEFTHNGKKFTIARPAPLNYTFTAYGCTLSTTGEDLDNEFGVCPVAWSQYIEEAMCDAGALVYSSVLEAYCAAKDQDDLEHEVQQEWEWAAEHVRQESRQDIFR